MNAEGHHSRCPSIVQCYPETICAATIRSLFSPLSRGVAREREGNPLGGVTWWMSLRWSSGLLSLQGCAFRYIFHDGQSRSKLIESEGQSAAFPRQRIGRAQSKARC